jgi:hypothetical protein
MSAQPAPFAYRVFPRTSGVSRYISIKQEGNTIKVEQAEAVSGRSNPGEKILHLIYVLHKPLVIRAVILNSDVFGLSC